MPAKINNKIKKVLLVFTSLTLLFTSLVQPLVPTVKAQTWYNQGFTDWYSKVYDESVSSPDQIFGERYTAAQVQWIFYGLVSLPINLIGSKYPKAITCAVTWNDSADKIGCRVEIIRTLTEILITLKTSSNTLPNDHQDNKNVIAIIFSDYQTRELSGIKYVSSSINKFLSVQEANAQGFGFNAVSGLQTYWSGFRNIAYSLTVLVVVVFAFMIMFKVKISPQVVITVQSALPKVFIALMLATFSYAIAGFVIDLSYVVGGLFSSLMELAGFGTFSQAFDKIVPIASTNAFGGFYIFFYMLAYTIMFFFATVISLIAVAYGFSSFGALASIVMILVTIWVFILMLWYTIKIPWILLKNLVSLYVSIVVAPVQIVIGSLIPTIGFGTWLKKIIAETLVFPVTGLFMFLAYQTLLNSFYINELEIGEAIAKLLGATNSPPPDSIMWVPPIIGSAEDMSGLLWIVVSFMFIVMLPKVVDIMKMLIMGQKFDFGMAINEAVRPAQSVWGATGGNVVRSIQEGSQRDWWTNNGQWIMKLLGKVKEPVKSAEVKAPNEV